MWLGGWRVGGGGRTEFVDRVVVVATFSCWKSFEQ
jgi:hypothetical protein